MLNELFELRRSMEHAGIRTTSRNKNYKQLPKYPAIRLFLGVDGHVEDMAPLEAQETAGMRKWELSNGFSFPAFNAPPLYQIIPEETNTFRSALNAVRRGTQLLTEDDLRQWLAKSTPLWGKNEKTKIDESLQVISQKVVALIGPPEDIHGAFHELARRAAQLDAKRLAEDISRLTLQKIKEQPVNAGIWLECLLVTAGVSKPRCLVLELADWAKTYPYPANHSEMTTWINTRLMDAQNTATEQATPGTGDRLDAFGAPYSAARDTSKYPSVNLPRLGPVILRAMSNETPAQQRYGRTDAASFPAGAATQQSFKDALEWIGAPSRRGIAWVDVTRSSGMKSALLFAYPSKLAPEQDDNPYAGLFTSDMEDSSREKTFEVAAQSILPTLSGLLTEEPAAELRILVLAKADKARTKVLFSRSYSVRALIDAAKDWQEGAANIPDMFWFVGPKAAPEEPCRPCTPFPAEVVECGNFVWLRDATQVKGVQGLSIGDGLSLLMERGSQGQALARRGLAIALARALPLLLALGATPYWSEVFNGKIRSYGRHGRLWPSLLGIFLHKLDISKGAYMHDSPFLVGRLLSLADDLHKLYCQEVRNAVPPQLLGNSLMRIALDSPAKGLARLTERLPVYQGWATTFAGNDKETLVKVRGVLARMGEVSMELADKALPESLDDPGKAAMLLGYLARTKKQEPANNN